MAKPLNQRCLSCAELPSEQARQRSCWAGQVCHNRRSYYRTRRPSATATDPHSAVPVIDVPLPDSAYAILYRYLGAQNALHAVSCELYQGSQMLAKTKPIHTAALTERIVRVYLQTVLEQFSRQADAPIALFREMVDLPLEHYPCPVEDCHLRRLSTLANPAQESWT